MKILTEKEQLEKKREEIFEAIRFEDNEIKVLNDKIGKSEDGFFIIKSAVRVMRWECEKKRQTVSLLYEYRDYINRRIEELKLEKQNKP